MSAEDFEIGHAGRGQAIGVTSGARTEGQLSSVNSLGDLLPGQVWSYAGRPGEEESHLTVLRLEKTPGISGIVHIRIEGVKLAPPGLEHRAPDFLPHLPFAEKALLPCLKEVEWTLADAAIPDHETGYQQWREAYLSGRGGVYLTSVAETLDAMARVLANR